MSSLFNARMSQCAPMLLLGAVLLSLVKPSHAADELSLARAVQLAVQRSHQLAGQNAGVQAAREMAIAASQLPDPVLKAGIDNLPVTGRDQGSLNADFMTMRRIGFSQEITRSDKRSLRAERYKLEAQKGEAEREQTRTTIARDTALAWLELHHATSAAAMIEAQRKQLAQEALAADAAYRGGHGNQADLLTARAAVVLAEDRVADATRRVRSTRIMLARWVGDAAAEQALAPLPAMDAIPFGADKLESQLERTPVIAALAGQEAVVANEARLAEANRKPDWTVDVAWQQRGAGYSNMVSFGVSIPLQWDRKQRQDRELTAKLSQADQARAEREEAQRAQTAEIRTLIEDWRSGLERQQRYRDELLPLAQQRSDAVLSAYRSGKAKLEDVLAARRNELEARLSALQLEADTAHLWAQLNYILPTEQK